MNLKRQQITIQGVVQGVGFRPHVYHTAIHLNLTGWVKNNNHGVIIEIQGSSTDQFLSKLKESLPPLARIDAIQCQKIPLIQNEKHFQIKSSEGESSNTIISPDIGICQDCLKELFDPKSRYYLYPFLNCTQCGPRLTVTRQLPYDRAQTSMDTFSLCSACEKDYSDPINRRYHAQPTACSLCGPQLSTSIKAMAKAIQQGKILAVKGLGGYQLICDAWNKASISTLRARKKRAAKPFAVLVPNLKSAEQIVSISPLGRELLTCQTRPIVLLNKLMDCMPEDLAPGLNQLGIMLPTTPIHYLLFHAIMGFPRGLEWLDKPDSTMLVVTSANVGGNPLLIDDTQAEEALASIADLTISYNRNIVTRVDDSVIKLINHSPAFIRRARGYVPQAIKLPFTIPTTLALGGHLKNTFCITRKDEAFVSQYIGSLSNKDTIEFFHESLEHLQDFLNIKPEQVACDLHPDFYTTQLAETYDCPMINVQHQHAHLASVAAEHHIIHPALGLALDGYGYGTQGASWGGELMLLDNACFERLGSFYPLTMPGGDRVAKEPWRMGASVLHELGLNEEISARFGNMTQAKYLSDLLVSQCSLPATSSCGRYFDAASALLGVTHVSNYEGHAAQLLESLVTEPEVISNGWIIENGHFNLLPTFAELLELDPITGSNRFHGTLVAGLSEWILIWVKNTGLRTVLLSGGCFLNQRLTEGLIQTLSQRGLSVYLPKQLPANDGGISLGQAWVAGVANCGKKR
ncbi:carbamoyltransferase HypF [Legionella israelensis]|uniref:Carbamoyltransferase HypF n=1 Tax=Legionella israelensis TaxID=454 RepID=A0A0W0V1X2_9GAMM|nr:carbamoyltransferase HypF [Legionella israelensis]KTD14113.1 hydrogenase maturation protein HypF [Legionella israelensis]QBS10322.1 carbamoyltransferase HypF [Legionella israelensis]SCY34624.1 Hydrogenase maturation protein, carbamoyltransferase HypF [Legionella israelensis DSM 19235]STX59923.1 hydrogenase maturation protein HypF [Legionella israelensis]